MKNEDLSKRISELESELEKLKQELKQKPSIFDRCPVGRIVCGMEILGHDDTHIPFKIRYENGVAWLEKEIVETLANCHDWIEKYYPFLEQVRTLWEDNTRGPIHSTGKAAQEAGLWANKTPIKKPWEEK